MKGRDTRTALRSVSDLRTGDHICGIYRTDEEHRDLVSAFIKDGLFRNEKVLYILDCHTAATITGYLEGYGADPATPQGPGQLVFASAADTYLKGGSFNPDAMIEFLGSETEKALSEGYSALRVTGEMSWAGRNLSGSDRLTEYEIHLNSFLESHTCTCLCQYDERLFPPSVLLDVLLTHPIAVIGRTLYDNFYYIPSVDLPGQNLGAVLFGHWKEGLATYAATRKRVEEMAEFPEQNPQPVCELGRDGQLRYCNPAGYRHFPDITNEGGRHLLFGDYTALFSELEKDPGTVILKETPFGGRWYELAVSYVPGRDSIRIYSTDISHRKSAGMALKESEEKFRLLADFTPDWEYWVDNEYRIVYMSPSCELITGYPAGDFYRTKNFIQEIIHPNDIGRYKIHESWMMNKKEAGELEFRIIRRDGTERWIRHSCRPVIDKAGRFLGIRVSNQDISGQKHAEREIQQKDKLLHMTGEMAKVGGWEFNAVTGAGSWTDEVARIHGLDPDVTTTMQFGVSFFTGESRKRIEQAIREAVEDARPYDLELEMMSADGLHKWVRTHGIPIQKEGKVVSIRGIIQDITGLKEAELQRESLIRELKAKNTELERFTYTVSHDLKTPLITIEGFSGYLLEDIEKGDGEKIKDDINRIQGAIAKMGQLLRELLELSRIGRIMNPPEHLPGKSMVEEALNLQNLLITSRGVNVIVHEPLPEVYGDRIRLVEVISNLIENAVKFMGVQPAPVLEIGVVEKNRETAFFVRDNGIGIAPEYLEKVFDLFEKVDPAIVGTGVGLAIVKRIVEVHNGKVWVESDGVGKGSTFFFTLGTPEQYERDRAE